MNAAAHEAKTRRRALNRALGVIAALVLVVVGFVAGAFGPFGQGGDEQRVRGVLEAMAARQRAHECGQQGIASADCGDGWPNMHYYGAEQSRYEPVGAGTTSMAHLDEPEEGPPWASNGVVDCGAGDIYFDGQCLPPPQVSS